MIALARFGPTHRCPFTSQEHSRRASVQEAGTTTAEAPY
jgi:hypothetical protein